MASFEEIQRKQNAMKPLLEELATERNADRVQQLGKQIAEMAQELARMADGLQRAFSQPSGGTGETRIVLTKEQRERIAEATGVAIDVLVLKPANVWDPQVPKMTPDIIERLAMASVADRKLKEEKCKAAKQIVSELEAAVGGSPAPETRDAIDQFKREHLEQ
jgi:hypothetical protein